MADTLLVDEGHPSQNLFHEVLNVTDRYRLINFFGLLDHFFEVLTAILKNEVLHFLSLLIF